MSNFILTNIKKMAKILTVPRFYGPLATVAFTLAYHLAAHYFGFSITLSWLWLFMIAGAFLGGLRAGLLCSVLTVAYAVYALPMETSRQIQLAIASPLAVYIVGWQTKHLREALFSAQLAQAAAQAALERSKKDEAAAKAALARAEENEAAAEALTALNGNVLRIRTARNILAKTLDTHPLDETTRDEMRQVLYVLNNLELATSGWIALKKLKASIESGD